MHSPHSSAFLPDRSQTLRPRPPLPHLTGPALRLARTDSGRPSKPQPCLLLTAHSVALYHGATYPTRGLFAARSAAFETTDPALLAQSAGGRVPSHVRGSRATNNASVNPSSIRSLLGGAPNHTSMPEVPTSTCCAHHLCCWLGSPHTVTPVEHETPQHRRPRMLSCFQALACGGGKTRGAGGTTSGQAAGRACQ